MLQVYCLRPYTRISLVLNSRLLRDKQLSIDLPSTTVFFHASLLPSAMGAFRAIQVSVLLFFLFSLIPYFPFRYGLLVIQKYTFSLLSIKFLFFHPFKRRYYYIITLACDKASLKNANLYILHRTIPIYI